MKTRRGAKPFARRPLTLGLIAVLILTVATLYLLLLKSPTRVYEATDFLGYWAAASLLAHQENPYDQEALLLLQREQGWQALEPMYSWNPPWLHLILLPLGALSFRQAAALWFVLNPLLIGLSALLLWNVVSPRRGLAQIGVALLAAFLFSRSLHALLEGQMNTLVLLGCASFLTLALARRDLLAGAALVLVTVKPHLAYLLLPAVLLIGLLQRRWQIVIGFSVSLMVLLLLATWLAPDWGQTYITLLNVPASPLRTTAYITPTIRGLVLALTGFDSGSWLAVVSLVIFIALVTLRGRNLDVPTIASLSVILGLPTAPFGWSTDQILLLLPILQIIASMRTMERAHKCVIASSLALVYAYALWVWVVCYRDVAFVILPPAIGLVWWYALWRVPDEGRNRGQVLSESGFAGPR